MTRAPLGSMVCTGKPGVCGSGGRLIHGIYDAGYCGGVYHATSTVALGSSLKSKALLILPDRARDMR